MPQGGYKRRAEVSRRDFLKIVLPGGWIPEAKRYGFGELSNAAKISMAKDGAIVLGTSALVTKNTLAHKHAKEKPLNEVLTDFTWKDAEDDNELQRFSEVLADEYLRSTKSTRLTKEDLVGSGSTNFHRKTTDFVETAHSLDPNVTITDSQWGYSNLQTGKVNIDLETLQRVGAAIDYEAGTSLIDALWHEWGHLDVVRRTTGEFLNNPTIGLVSPDSQTTEMFESYLGGNVITENLVGLNRFDEVWNESINSRRMVEYLGMDKIMIAGDYFENGVSFFPLLTSALNIPLDTLYQMHSTSDFEGLAKLIGERLPGEGLPIDKGFNLFVAIQLSDANLVAQTGALNLIPQG